MAWWAQGNTYSPMFLGAGGTQLGPFNAGLSSTQPLVTQRGDLWINYSCGGNAECGCGKPMPPGNGSRGVDDVFLCLNQLPDSKRTPAFPSSPSWRSSRSVGGGAMRQESGRSL